MQIMYVMDSENFLSVSKGLQGGTFLFFIHTFMRAPVVQSQL